MTSTSYVVVTPSSPENVQCLFLAEATDFLKSDPDQEDHPGRTRHADRDLLNWAGIGKVAEAAGAEFVTGNAQSYDGSVFVTVPSEGLSKIEQKIVQSFFSAGEAIFTDVSYLDDPSRGDQIYGNGRHRTFNCWNADASLRLPLWSATAYGVVANQGESSLKEFAPAEASKQLSASRNAVLASSPLCKAFLTRISQGEVGL